VADCSSAPPVRGPAGRPILTSTLLDGIRRTWNLDDLQTTTDLGGSSTLNLRLAGPAGDVVARVYRSWVRPERVAAIQHARRQLALAGIPCVVPLPTALGDDAALIGGYLVELEPYVAWDGLMDGWARIEASLPLLGRIHTVLARDVPSAAGAIAPACNSIAPAALLPGVTAGVARLRSLPLSPSERDLATAALALASRVAQAEANVVLPAPQLVHGDFWHNNVYYRDGDIVLVADFDFMGLRHRIDDLALTLYYTNSTYADGRDAAGRRQQLRRLVDAYDTGLATPLATVERAALPLAIVRTALGFIAMMAQAESDEVVRTLAREMTPDLAWAGRMIDTLEVWQAAFTEPVHAART